MLLVNNIMILSWQIICITNFGNTDSNEWTLKYQWFLIYRYTIGYFDIFTSYIIVLDTFNQGLT